MNRLPFWPAARLLPLVLLLFAGSTVVFAQSGGVEGAIVDASTGDALPGASVLLSGSRFSRGMVTDEEGRFTFSGVPAGTYEVQASMLGYRNGSQQAVVQLGQTAALDFRLEAEPHGLEEVVVSATRMAMPVSAIPGAVTVLSEADIEQQAALGESLSDVLGKLVPGLGVSTGSNSIYGQSLRGRAMSVMIDGVPQSTTRNTSRDLATIDPGMIERVEVVRGATAIYGDGATGGIINIITRRPAAASAQFTTDASFGGSVSAPGDGLEGRLTQTATGRTGAFEYTASASLHRTSGYYDAEGDLIPSDPYGQGGLASTTAYGLQGRLGYRHGDGRLQLTFNHYTADQETEFVSDPSVNTLPAGTEKARAMKGLHLDDNQASYNRVASADYDHAAVLGGRVHAQVFYRDYLTRFSPFDGRAFAAYRNIIQSYLDSQKFGARLEYERTLHQATDLTALLGLDYTDERTQQPVFIIDSTAYDQSDGLVFEKVGERPWVPLMNPRKTGLFLQLAWQPVELLDLRGGVRYEPTRMHIDDFTTLIGNEVIGGKVGYDPVLFNAGVVLHTTRRTELFAAFSQGFSLTDLGLLLRNAADGFQVGNRTLEAQKVNSFEGGARATFAGVRGSVAGFYNESDLGTTSAGLDRGVIRAPERVYGVEATLDATPVRALSVGGTFTWTEGENDADEDGEYVALNSFRIQPLKLTGYLQHETRPGWSNRIQVLYSGARDRAFEERLNPDVVGFGEAAVESYVVLDLMSTLQVGQGALRAGVTNLLNTQYFPVVSQLMYNGANSTRAAAPGAALMLGYTVTY